jgi:hypothetical protein
MVGVLHREPAQTVAQLERLLGVDLAAHARPPSVDFSTSRVESSTLDAEVRRARPSLDAEVGRARPS